jgi:hypothetical protein
MSFPPGTEMFQFPGFASVPYEFRYGSSCEGVSPFGYPWIKGCSPLPMAFRSVPRPSSPPGAKASTECPFVVQLSSPRVNALNTHQALPTINRNHPSDCCAHLHFQTPPLGTARFANFNDRHRTRQRLTAQADEAQPHDHHIMFYLVASHAF